MLSNQRKPLRCYRLKNNLLILDLRTRLWLLGAVVLPDALYRLALKHAGMENGHKDLLSLDDLPYHRDQVARLVGEFVLVDHPRVSLLRICSSITHSFCSSTPLVRQSLVSQYIADVSVCCI